MSEIAHFLAQLPNVLVFIIPGFLALEVYRFLLPTKKRNTFERLLESIFLSYLIYGLFLGINWLLCAIRKTNNNVTTDQLATSTIYIILLMSIIIGIALALISKSALFKNAMKRVFNISIIEHPTVWNAVLQRKDSAWVRVYLDNDRIIYIGWLDKYSCNPNDDVREIYLTSYQSYSYDEPEHPIDNFIEIDTNGVLINADRISRIELF